MGIEFHPKIPSLIERVRRATSVYELSPKSLPVTDPYVPVETSDQHLAEALFTLGYPGFRYLHSHSEPALPKSPVNNSSSYEGVSRDARSLATAS